MVTMRAALSFLAVLVLGAAPSLGYVASGKVSGSPGTPVYLDKFCYGTSQHNDLRWAVSLDAATDVYLVALVDTKESYTAYKDRRLDCAALEGLGGSDVKNGYSFPVASPDYTHYDAHPVLTDHPHFWRVYALSCTSPYTIKYKLTFLNNGSQFSQEMSGILWLYVAFVILFSLLLALWTLGCWRLRQMMNYIHPLVKILTTALVTQFLAVFLFCVQYAIFALNGRGFLAVLTVARIFEMASIIIFTFFLLCLAKGWTVTTSVLSQRWLLVVVFSFYALFYLILLLWNLYATEYVGEEVNSFYSSVPGICLIIVRLLTLLWFLWSILATISSNNISSDKRVFLGIYGAVGSVWFVSMPVIVVFTFLLEPWNRGVMVESTFQVATYLLYLVFVYLMWPSRAERYFRISAQEYLYDSVANDEL